jgi:hypothetical protein
VLNVNQIRLKLGRKARETALYPPVLKGTEKLSWNRCLEAAGIQRDAPHQDTVDVSVDLGKRQSATIVMSIQDCYLVLVAQRVR